MKKSDIRDCELLEKSVNGIRSICGYFEEWLSEGFKLNTRSMTKMVSMTNDLNALIDAYFDNKFSSPANSIMMFKELDRIREVSRDLIDTTTQYMQITTAFNMINTQYENGVEVDIEDAKQTYQQAMHEVNIQLNRCITIMTDTLGAIMVCVNHDFVKLTIGVDIISEYKHRLKKLPKGLGSSVDVRFNIQNMGDKEFIIKEQVKNERSGKRTPNGGPPETL